MPYAITLDVRKHIEAAESGDAAEYNTHHHSVAEINAALGASAGSFTHVNPPGRLYAYGPYASTITKLQGIPPSHCHTLTFPSYLLQDFNTQFMRFYNGRTVNVDGLVEDALAILTIRECVIRIFSTSLSYGNYFVRLPDASPKDSPHWGPVTSAERLILLICTSMRASNQITDRIALEQGLTVFLRPWDDEIQKGVEFRVFVPPVLSEMRDFKVAAISQYVWHKPFPIKEVKIARDIVKTAVGGALSHLNAIKTAAQAGGTMEGLRLHGFTMDLIVKKNAKEAQLVEINPFGAASPCGSCLFHWIRDGRRLYGLEDGIAVRISAEHHEGCHEVLPVLPG